MPTHALLVHCTCPDRKSADRLAKRLVERRLAACVSILPGIVSTYTWQDVVEQSDELLLLIKSDQRNYPALERCIAEHHPYELPEILAVPVVQGLPAYLHWIDQCTASDS